MLLLEDEPLVAMVMKEFLLELGCEVLGPERTLEAALRRGKAEAGRIDAAVLDVNLSGCPAFPVADMLARQGVPVILATGYGDLPDGRLPGKACVLLRKPIRRGELEAMLSHRLPPLPGVLSDRAAKPVAKPGSQ